MIGIAKGGLAAILSLAVNLGPVLKFIGEEFTVEICNALLHPRLRVRDCQVVNHWPDFFNEEVEQQACGKVADGFGHIFLKVALD